MNDLSRTPLSDEEPSKEFGRFGQVAQAPVKVFLSGQAATELIPLLKKLGSIEVVKEMPGDPLDQEVAKALTTLDFTPEHVSPAPAHTLREFERAGSALRIICSLLNQSLEQFMNRPFEDYSGQTPTDLVQKHGAPALEALANDLAYPTPA